MSRASSGITTTPADATRLSAFFSHFGDMRRAGVEADLPARLAELFTRLRPLLAAPAEAAPGSPTDPVTIVDEARLRSLFARLAGPLEQARRDGRLADVWDIAGLGRNELRNAAALAALWNPRLCGSVAVAFLAEFLARVGPGENIPSRAELAAGYIIRTEDHPEGEASERVDITVEGATFLLGIELKIDAGEGQRQLARYHRALKSRAMRRLQLPSLIYLSPRPPLDAFARESGLVHHARWTDIAAAARAAIPKAGERRFTDQLVAQFAAHVSMF